MSGSKKRKLSEIGLDEEDAKMKRRRISYGKNDIGNKEFFENDQFADVIFLIPTCTRNITPPINTPTTEEKDSLDTNENEAETSMVEYVEYPCFKSYFAPHSKYFETVLYKNMAPTTKTKIALNDIDCDTFECIRDWCYPCKKVDLNKENVLSVLTASFKYDMKNLVSECVDFVCQEWIVCPASLYSFIVSASKFECEMAKQGRPSLAHKYLDMILNDKRVVPVIKVSDHYHQWTTHDGGKDISIDVIKCLFQFTPFFEYTREDIILYLVRNYCQIAFCCYDECVGCERWISSDQTCCRACKMKTEKKFEKVEQSDKELSSGAQSVLNKITRDENGDLILLDCPVAACFHKIEKVDIGTLTTEKAGCSFCIQVDEKIEYRCVFADCTRKNCSICQSCSENDLFVSRLFRTIFAIVMDNLVPFLRFENIKLKTFIKNIQPDFEFSGLMSASEILKVHMDCHTKKQNKRYKFDDNIIEPKMYKVLAGNEEYPICLVWKKYAEPGPMGGYIESVDEKNETVDFYSDDCDKYTFTFAEIVCLKMNFGVGKGVFDSNVNSHWSEGQYMKARHWHFDRNDQSPWFNVRIEKIRGCLIKVTLDSTKGKNKNLPVRFDPSWWVFDDDSSMFTSLGDA